MTRDELDTLSNAEHRANAALRALHDLRDRLVRATLTVDLIRLVLDMPDATPSELVKAVESLRARAEACDDEEVPA